MDSAIIRSGVQYSQQRPRAWAIRRSGVRPPLPPAPPSLAPEDGRGDHSRLKSFSFFFTPQRANTTASDGWVILGDRCGCSNSMLGCLLASVPITRRARSATPTQPFDVTHNDHNDNTAALASIKLKRAEMQKTQSGTGWKLAWNCGETKACARNHHIICLYTL